MSKTTTKNRTLRVAIVAAVAGALASPLISQYARAKDKQETSVNTTDVKTADGKLADDTVIASANDVKVTAGEVGAVLAGMPPQQRNHFASTIEARRELLEQLVKVKVLAGEAEKRKLGEDPRVKTQLEASRRQVLAQALVASIPAGEEEDKKFFDAHPEEFGKVQARHILISTGEPADPNNPKEALTDEQAKKKADDIRARLAKGEDFAALAKAESDDPGSKETGGEYTFGRGMMVPAFEKAAYALKENEISQPIKTPFGYHVIQLQKRLPGTFADARNQVSALRFNAFVKELMGGAEIKMDERFLSESEPPPAPSEDGPPAQ